MDSHPLSSSSLVSSSFSAVCSLSPEAALEDTPETREQLRAAAAAAESAKLQLQAVVRRAASLREALRSVDKERAALATTLRAMESVLDESSPLKTLCDSMEESNKLAAAESLHVGALLIDPLLPLTEDPGQAKKDHKHLCKLRANFDSWADKVAANERKDIPSGKGDDAMVQLIDARLQYRKGLLDYLESVKKGHRDMKAKVCKQLLEFWITRHSSIRSIEKTSNGKKKRERRKDDRNLLFCFLHKKSFEVLEVQPHVVAALVHETEDAVNARRDQERREAEQRRAIESSDNFPGGVVCHNQFLQGWLWHRSSGKLGTWSKRFFRVKDGVLRAVGEGETTAIPLVTARVKPCVGEVDRRRCFLIVGYEMNESGMCCFCFCFCFCLFLIFPRPSDELLLQAGSQQELELWQKVIETETVRLLNDNSAEKAVFSCGEQRAGGSGPLEKMYAADAINAICADCGSPGPDWAAINLGVLFCIACSGVHRSMGVHISKVRSFRLDSWSDGELAVMQRLGNTRVSLNLLEAKKGLVEKPTPESGVAVRESFIQAKYARKEMMAPVPYEALNGGASSSLDDALLHSIGGADLEKVLHLLLLGASANAGKGAALVKAAEAGDLAAMELLLLHGADVRREGDVTSALHAAATRGDVQMASALFKRGADPEARDEQGSTPAQRAAAAGNADCVTLLRLASLSAAEKEGMRGDFAGLLEEFSRNLAERREQKK